MKKIVNVIVLMLATLLMLMAAGQTALAEEQAISAKEMMRLLLGTARENRRKDLGRVRR